MREQELNKHIDEIVSITFDNDEIVGKLFKIVDHKDSKGNLHSVKNGYYVEYIKNPHVKGIDFCKSHVKKIKKWGF